MALQTEPPARRLEPMSATGTSARLDADPGESSYPSARYAWYVLAIFFLAAILSYTDRLILNLLVDPIRDELQISETQISLLQGAAFAVFYALISLPLGRYADRHNRRNLIAIGIAVWSVATAVCGLATSFPGLVVARICVGLGEAALAPAVMSMIPDYFPEARRGTAYGVFVTGMVMGGGGAALIGGALLDGFQSGQLAFLPLIGHMVPWRAVLVALSLPGVLLLALILTVREPVRRDSLAARVEGEAGFGATLRYFSDNRWTFIFLISVFALGNMVGYGGASWMPSVFARRFGLSAAEIGYSFGLVSLIANGVGAILGGLLSDRLVQRGGADRALWFVLWTSVATLPLLAFSVLPTVTLILACYSAFVIVSSMAGTAGIAVLQNAVPSEMRGFSVALQACTYTLVGLGLGPTSIAITTEYVFQDPQSVGLSIFAVSLSVTAASIVLIWLSISPYRATRQRMALATGSAAKSAD